MDCSKNNYRNLYRPDEPGAKVNGNIAEHRYIAQNEILHRPLTSEEVVHHIDKVKYHNDVSNLMVFDNQISHNLYHFYDPSEIKVIKGDDNVNSVKMLTQIVERHRPENERVCKGCGKVFYVLDPNNTREYCCVNCMLYSGRGNKK